MKHPNEPPEAPEWEFMRACSCMCRCAQEMDYCQWQKHPRLECGCCPSDCPRCAHGEV